MHDAVVPLRGLIGTWRGEGVASYPTMADFPYIDEVTFRDIGKPLLDYSQRTWAPDGRLMHVESGYLRVMDEGQIEVVVAMPTGQVEIGGGEVSADDAGIFISTDAQVHVTPTAKRVDRIVRSYRCSGDALTYDFAMAAVGVGLTAHLHSELTRQ